MSDNQEDIARRVRALLAKTVANGCTEAEALAAAQAARRIMDAHRLTQSDVQIEAEPIDSVQIERSTAKKLAAVDLCCGGIDRYCGTKSWFDWKWSDTRGSIRCWHVMGLKSDVEMARYLYEMLARTIASETKRYPQMGRDAAETRQLNQSFSVGMAQRINTRLHAMAREADAQAVTSTGTALMVVKDHVVDAAFEALGLKLRGSLGGPKARDADAWNAGRAAGDRVNLSRPVGGAVQGRIA